MLPRGKEHVKMLNTYQTVILVSHGTTYPCTVFIQRLLQLCLALHKGVS